MSASLSLLFLGATTTISLVAAIGAQGTFVLRQGILGRHITPIIIFCILSDALMIGLGVVGLGALLDAAPWFIEVFRYVGARFWRGLVLSLAAACLLRTPSWLMMRRAILSR